MSLDQIYNESNKIHECLKKKKKKKKKKKRGEKIQEGK